MQVEVALHLPTFGAFAVAPGFNGPPPVDTPWAEREKAFLDVDPTETLGQVLDRAMPVLGIVPTSTVPHSEPLSHSLAGVAFYVDNETEGRSKGHRWYPVVGDDGFIHWDMDAIHVSMDRLVAAHRMGLFAGDPRKIYLVPQSTAGAVDVDWVEVLAALKAIANGINQFGGTVAGVAVIAAWVKKGHRVFQKYKERWASRGATIGRIRDVALQKPWKVEEISRLLGCVDSDAREVLQFFGMEEGSDGLWRAGSSDASKVEDLIALAVLHSSGIGLFPDGAQENASEFARTVLESIARGDQTPESLRTIVVRIANPDYDPG